MNARWFFSHDDVTHGPFSEEEMQQRVAAKLIVASDFVWRQGDAAALPADTVFNFAPAAAVPDWLADIVTVESTTAVTAPVPGTEVPEWLEDLGLWIALERFTPEKPAEKPKVEITASAPAEGVPDWLQGWLVPETPKPTPTPVKPAAAPIVAPPVVKLAPPSPAPPVKPPAAPIEIKPAPPSPVVKPATPVEAPPSAPVVKPATPAPPPPVVKAATPVEAPPPKPATPAVPQSLADKVREATGFDADTGQIIDPVKFAQWKQQQARPAAAGQPSVSNASIFEIFRKGRTAIETWIDDDKNRLIILHAEPDEIKKNPQMQAILQQFANYGNDLTEKLLRHLEFMVENRRKYYKAIEGRK